MTTSNSSRLLIGFLLALGACTGTEERRAAALWDELEQADPFLFSGVSSTAALRVNVERDARVQALIAGGSASAKIATERFGRMHAERKYQVLAVASYVIERTGYAAAVPELERFLRSETARNRHNDANPFVVHTLLVLKHLPDPDGGYGLYDPDDVARALL